VLDVLSKVPWKTNQKVLKVVEEVWMAGGGMGTIPIKYNDMKTYVYQFNVREERDYKKKEQLEKRIQ
jgi:DNA-directed RNA polymerase